MATVTPRLLLLVSERYLAQNWRPMCLCLLCCSTIKSRPLHYTGWQNMSRTIRDNEGMKFTDSFSQSIANIDYRDSRQPICHYNIMNDNSTCFPRTENRFVSSASRTAIVFIIKYEYSHVSILGHD